MWTAGPYVLVQFAAPAPGIPTGVHGDWARPGVVIDDDTGQRWTVPLMPAGQTCEPEGVGGGAVFFECSADGDPIDPYDGGFVELYMFKTGALRMIPDPRSVCRGNECGGTPVQLGTDWIEFDNVACYASYNVNEHCYDTPPDGWFFENLTTGLIAPDPTSGTTIADPNSPGLTEKLCAPLRVPRYADAWQTDTGTPESEIGSVTLAGRYALIASGPDDFSVEQCGSTRTVRVDPHGGGGPNTGNPSDGACVPPWCGPAINRHAVAWQTNEPEFYLGPGRITGRVLPSMTSFTATIPTHLPTALAAITEVAAGTKHLYVINEAGELWQLTLT